MLDKQKGRFLHHVDVRMIPRRPGLRRVAWLAVGGLALLWVGGCTLTRFEPVSAAPVGTRIDRLTGSSPARVAPDPRTISPALVDLEASLRRITVRYIKYTVLSTTDPQPLMSEQQIGDYARILASELPRLKDNQWLRFAFTDRHFGKGYSVEMDVYRESVHLVYLFRALASSPDIKETDENQQRFLGLLDPQPGQEVKNLGNMAYVKDPLVVEAREAAITLDAKRNLLEAAQRDELVGKDEAKRLAVYTDRASPSLDAWKSYWDKRRTLKKALEQNLIDHAAYQLQVDRLNADLER